MNSLGIVKRCLFLLAVVLLPMIAASQSSKVKSPALIPAPQIIECESDDIMINDYWVDSAGDFSGEIKHLQKILKAKGLSEVKSRSKADFIISIRKGNVQNPRSYEGAYQLKTDKNSQIVAENRAGVYYATQTLRQLISQRERKNFLASCTIQDWPAFKYRGYMVDLGRNYQSIEQLKEQIRVMANYKMNRLHLHLTDDPGWRLESKKYPELQSENATSRKPGHFYTQQEFIELVDFSARHHIAVIPELDIPGHTEAFRKALDIDSMNTPRVQQIILDVIEELVGLVPAVKMPYIHLGTDEARRESEQVDPDFLKPIFQRVHSHDRQVIHWKPGIKVPEDSSSIDQLWMGNTEPRKGHPFVDSRANYLNHLDPLAGMYRLFFQQPTRAAFGNEKRLGGELCLWHDNRVEHEINLLRQNPVYPGMVTYSEAVWTGKKKSYGRKYWSNLPPDSTEAYLEFREFESRLLIHRERYFRDKPFPYLKNAHIPWRIIGPFDHNGDMSRSFPVETQIKDQYFVDGESHEWHDEVLYGGTIHLKHFFGFPSPVEQDSGTVYALTYVYSHKKQRVGAWIGFNNWSRSGGRRGGPTPVQGEWDQTKPKVWINDEEVVPPQWNNPGVSVKSSEIPFSNEDYYYRVPTRIVLQKGWNKVLLKVPHGGSAWKWMFTFVPVNQDKGTTRIARDIKFSVQNEQKAAK